MSEAMTPAELAQKIDWEGGVVSALRYGLVYEDLDDSDAELKVAWGDVCQAWTDFKPVLEKLGPLLDKHLDELWVRAVSRGVVHSV